MNESIAKVLVGSPMNRSNTMKSRQLFLGFLWLAVCGSIFNLIVWAQKTDSIPTKSFPVHIRVDASQVKGPLRAVWRMFGADLRYAHEANVNDRAVSHPLC
jgi:hypothetical protein